VKATAASVTAAGGGARPCRSGAPTLANLLVIVLFILSCFGCLMFLWESFGGPLPLKTEGIPLQRVLPRTLALAEQSDVRISGVEVGT